MTPTAANFRLTVDVTDNGNGKLTCTVNLLDGGLAFLNTYATGDPVSIGLAGTKSLSVPEGLEGSDIAGKFTFTVEGEAGAPMPERTNTTNDANGNVDFGSITFTLDDLRGPWARLGTPRTRLARRRTPRRRTPLRPRLTYRLESLL